MRVLVPVLMGLTLTLAVACGGGGDNNARATVTPAGGGAGGNGAAATQAPAASQPPGGGTSSGTLPDACTLLSEAQIAAAMGEASAMKRGDPPTAALARCQWDGATAGRRFVYLTIRQAQFGTSVFNNSFKSRADGQAVSGIGKEAVALPGMDTPNNYRFASMAVLTETLFIQIDIAGPNRSDAEALAGLTSAMRTVLGSIR